MDMGSGEFKQFIDAMDRWLLEKYNVPQGSPEQAYGRMTKITEEVGELASEVGCALGKQRQEKMDKTNISNLGYEMADVILTVFLLAKTMNVDVPAAIEWKIKHIKEKLGI